MTGPIQILRPSGLLLALALAVLAVCTLGVSAPSALAAAPTTLTATAAPGVVVYPGAAVVSGTVTGENGPLAGAPLALYKRAAGAVDWASTGRTAVARTDGTYRFGVKPSVSTEYEVSFADDGVQAAAVADAIVRVRPDLSTSFPASLWLGDTVQLRGAVAPAHPGASVVIERRVAGAWQPLTTATLNDKSRFTVGWTPDAFGYFRLRARMEADADHEAGVSAAKLVTVNRPNAHHVPMHYAHYIVIVRHEYRLYYYEHGVMVRGFNVALGRPGFRTPLGYFHIYGKRKPAGGALGACAMFYRQQGGIAIHGTNEPWLLSRPLPRDFSHGCARMYNSQVLWLYARVPVGTHVHNLR